MNLFNCLSALEKLLNRWTQRMSRALMTLLRKMPRQSFIFLADLKLRVVNLREIYMQLVLIQQLCQQVLLLFDAVPHPAQPPGQARRRHPQSADPF